MTYVPTANKLRYQQMPTRRLPVLPVVRPHFLCRQPVFTNSLRSSPTETTSHSCQPTAQIHSPTLPLYSHIPFCHPEDSLEDRKQPEIDNSPEANSLDSCRFIDSGHGVGRACRVQKLAQTGKGLAQPTYQNEKSSWLQQGPLVGKSKICRESS